MNEPLQALWRLSEAARHHAQAEFGLNLAVATPAEVDPLLLDLRQRCSDDESDEGRGHLEGHAACYGVWLGFWAVREFAARWVGLHEPAAPRLQVGAETFSPIDTARRILLGAPGSRPLAEVSERIRDAARRFEDETRQYLGLNREAWERRANDPTFAGPPPLPAAPEQVLAAIDPWVRSQGVAGRCVLCLAAGGGLHGPLYALAGAQVTVVDVSPGQLAHDRRFAREHGVELQTLCRSIDDLEGLPEDQFDVVVQPVSSCYVPDVGAVYREVARVIRPGGIYVSQHKHPSALQCDFGPPRRGDATPSAGRPNGYRVVTASGEGRRLPEAAGGCAADLREAGAAEYLHTLDALIGGLCDAGFAVVGFREPPRGDALAPPGSYEHRAAYLPPYLKIQAIRR